MKLWKKKIVENLLKFLKLGLKVYKFLGPFFIVFLIKINS